MICNKHKNPLFFNIRTKSKSINCKVITNKRIFLKIKIIIKISVKLDIDIIIAFMWDSPSFSEKF